MLSGCLFNSETRKLVVRVRPTALQKRWGATPSLVAAPPSRCQTLSGGSCTVLALQPSQSCCAWGVAEVAGGPGIWEHCRSAIPSPAPHHHKPLCGGGVQGAPWRVLWRRPIWSERTRRGQVEAKSTTNQLKIRFEVAGQMEPSLPNRPSSTVSDPLA